jgi:hypothetical protein
MAGITDGYIRKEDVEKGIENGPDEKDEKTINRRMRDGNDDEADNNCYANNEDTEGTVKILLNVEFGVTADRASIDGGSL